MLTNEEIVIKLHNIARTVESYGTSNLDAKEMREIADRFSDLAKYKKDSEVCGMSVKWTEV